MPQGSRNLTWTWRSEIGPGIFCDVTKIVNFTPIVYHLPLGPHPPAVSLVYLVYLGTFQRIVRRRQTQRRTEYQDSSLLTPPHPCVQPLQAHAEAPFSPKHSKLSPVWRQKAWFMQIQGYLCLSHKAPSPFPDICYCRIDVWIWFCLELLLIEITSNISISLSPNGIQLHKHVGSRWIHHLKISGYYSTWVKVTHNWAFVALYSNLNVSPLGSVIRNNTEKFTWLNLRWISPREFIPQTRMFHLSSNNTVWAHNCMNLCKRATQWGCCKKKNEN